MKQTRRRNDKATLSIRIIAGVYLLYIVYSIIKDWNLVKAGQKYFIGGAIIIFAIMGAFLCISSVLGLIRINRMQDNSADADTPSMADQDNDLTKIELKEDVPEEDNKENGKPNKDNR